MHKILAPIRRARNDGTLTPVFVALLVLVGLSVEAVAMLPGSEEAWPAMLALNLAALGGVGYLIASLLTCHRKAKYEREEEFTEMSRRLELALEVSQIGFWDVDLDTDTLRWDARSCQHMGVPYRGGYFTESDWLGAVHPDDRERALEAAQSAIKTGGRFISDYRVVWPGGEVRHLRDMATYYRSSDGRPRIAGLVWDVTADKEREAELELRRREAEAADKAKSSFLAAMSHEIRTPLGGVIGMLDLMQSDALTAEQAERARIASASAQSLLQLLNDVLDVTRLEAAAVSLCPAPVEVRRLVAEVSDLVVARVAQKDLTFASHVNDEVPECISVDPLRFRQVLTNIVSNAVCYTDQGFVEMRVGWAERQEWSGLEVEVRDSGIGISEADHHRIFQRFVQTEASVKRQTGGTGLGLAIARELVELMDGSIAVDSAPGGGSTFTFSVRAEPCAPSQSEGASAASGVLDVPLEILVAEDNATNRLLISSLLRRGGHRVSLVGNGREAVEAVRAGAFDVVLMDVQMPVMDGLAAARAIRALEPPARSVPIIALTASVLSDDRVRYREAEMDECLAKPIDIAALNSVLARLVTRASAGRRSRVA